MTEFKDAFL